MRLKTIKWLLVKSFYDYNVLLDYVRYCYDDWKIHSVDDYLFLKYNLLEIEYWYDFYCWIKEKNIRKNSSEIQVWDFVYRTDKECIWDSYNWDHCECSYWDYWRYWIVTYIDKDFIIYTRKRIWDKIHVNIKECIFSKKKIIQSNYNPLIYWVYFLW